MPPEVIKQTGHGRSADIWSVGATVIEMSEPPFYLKVAKLNSIFVVTAKHPWPEFSSNLAALFHVATSNRPPPFPPNISSALEALLSRFVSFNYGYCLSNY
jgi:serine/threonine protein kinase